MKKQLKIGVFGSSYSRGNSEVVDERKPLKKIATTGWPYELSQICEHEIWNHSIGGVSSDFSLEQYNKQKYKNFDFVIFDAATSLRYTVELQDIYYKRLAENYWEYTNDNINEVVLRYTGNRDNYLSDEERESKHYNIWKHKIGFEIEQVKASHADTLVKISKEADILFFQRYKDYKNAFMLRLDLKKHPCVQSILPEEEWQSYVLDQACHFNTNGSKWFAQWMLEQINIIYFGDQSA